MYDAVVIGLGGVGSFALRALAKQGGKKGLRVLGIEQFAPGHTKGSSHGRSRIYRRAYFEHPSYVPWVEYSLLVFRELEKTQNVSLLNECGCLLVAPSTSCDNKTPLPPLLAASHASALQHSIPVEFLTTNGLKERYPQLLYKYNMVGLLERQAAGILRPERVIQAALADALSSQASGSHVTIRSHTRVLSMETISDGVVALRVQHNGNGDEEEEILTRTVVLSAGAWANQLVPSWRKVLRVTRQFQCWIDMSQSASADYASLCSAEHLPAWYMETPDWHIPIYGIPCDPSADDPAAQQWLKVSTHGRESIVAGDPSFGNPSRLTATELEECTRAAMLGLNPAAWSRRPEGRPTFVETIPCMYTMTPDKHFLIGSPPPSSSSKTNGGGIFCVAGLSGHGFKMTPALGQMMADYVLGNDLSKWKLDFCSPSRFGL